MLTLLPLLLTFFYLGPNSNFFLGALICAGLIAGCFCYLALNKPEYCILSILMALAFTDRQLKFLSFSIYLINIVAMASFIHYFFNHPTGKKIFWFFAISVSSYCFLLMFIKPYSKPVPMAWIIFYMVQLAIFSWSMLIRWDTKKIMNIVVFHLIYLLAYGFIEKLALNPLRIGGPTTHATNYAILLTFLWTMWFVEAFLSKKHSIPVLVLASFLILFAVFLSGTRMGLVGIIIGLLGAFATSIWIRNLHKSLVKRLAYVFSIFLIIIITIAVIWQFLPQDTFIIRAWNVLLSGNLDASAMGRLVAWASSLDSFSKHPVWGVGPGNFVQANTEFIAKYVPLPAQNSIPELKHAHSIGLNVLAENGLVAFIMLLTIILVCYFQLAKFLIRNPRNSMGYMLLFGGIVIFCLPMIDMIPSPGWDSWYYGILASLGFHNNIPSPKQEDKFNVKPIGKHSEQ